MHLMVGCFLLGIALRLAQVRGAQAYAALCALSALGVALLGL